MHYLWCIPLLKWGVSGSWVCWCGRESLRVLWHNIWMVLDHYFWTTLLFHYSWWFVVVSPIRMSVSRIIILQNINKGWQYTYWSRGENDVFLNDRLKFHYHCFSIDDGSVWGFWSDVVRHFKASNDMKFRKFVCLWCQLDVALYPSEINPLIVDCTRWSEQTVYWKSYTAKKAASFSVDNTKLDHLLWLNNGTQKSSFQTHWA